MKCESTLEICVCNSYAMGLDPVIAPQRKHVGGLWGSDALGAWGKEMVTVMNFSVFMSITL